MAESKFGFVPEEEERKEDLALQFVPTPVDRPRHSILESDRAAVAVGFASREHNAQPKPVRRRRVNRETSFRMLSIRTPETLFARFLRYADRHELTYHDALAQLLDVAGEQD